ncbi:TlpA family protein disulfide reductase [Saccharothrix algeriensis]|uniref:Thiol-disulfide isomerase/thioredoxin n=1 Tax=Saccharothrix algeriensis TaxID=173560 RepID=A0A8T8HS05_9PSEU|nr:thioredoxin family protein [Saccharothrix algeriensis]MBM7812463.1 thiol-disulfide isomerase/thioredoxin [Saccharothrix algeriensis]QTR01207.1 thioredoxin family protein [Saccharothrix algeriensis]
MAGTWALLGSVALAAVIGVVLRVRAGRVRVTGRAVELPEPVRELLDPPAPVTLVQLSTAFCAPCRHARALLADLADRTEGLRHVELDVTDRPEVATGLGVLRTPTTLALDASGAELLRVGGVPRRDALLAALRPHLPEPNG